MGRSIDRLTILLCLCLCCCFAFVTECSLARIEGGRAVGGDVSQGRGLAVRESGAEGADEGIKRGRRKTRRREAEEDTSREHCRLC